MNSQQLKRKEMVLALVTPKDYSGLKIIKTFRCQNILRTEAM